MNRKNKAREEPYTSQPAGAKPSRSKKIPPPRMEVGIYGVEEGCIEENPKNCVLWLSRHEALPAQLALLKKKLGSFSFYHIKRRLQTAEEALSLIRKLQANYVVAVLPLSFIAHLAQMQKKGGFTLLWAEMELLHNKCPGEPCPFFNSSTDTIANGRHYRFKIFKKVVRVELVLERW